MVVLLSELRTVHLPSGTGAEGAPIPFDTKWLSPQEVADWHDVALSTVQKELESGRLKSVKMFFSRRRLVRFEDCEAWHPKPRPGSDVRAMIAAGVSGLITDCNLRAAVLFLYSKSQIIGVPITRLIPSRFLDRHRAAFARFVSSGGFSHPTRRTLRAAGLRSDGKEIPIEVDLSGSHKKATGEWVIVARMREQFESFTTPA